MLWPPVLAVRTASSSSLDIEGPGFQQVVLRIIGYFQAVPVAPQPSGRLLISRPGSKWRRSPPVVLGALTLRVKSSCLYRLSISGTSIRYAHALFVTLMLSSSRSSLFVTLFPSVSLP